MKITPTAKQRLIYGAEGKAVRFTPKTYVPVSVPDVVGMSIDAAVVTLSSAYLGTIFSGTIGGTVTEQSPIAAELVAPYSCVTVIAA